MQLKDKLDFGFVKTKKTLIRKIVFTLLKFLIVVAACYVVNLLLTLFIFNASDEPKIMVFVLALLLVISLISCTIGLVRALYFADDNKVLITFPVSANVIFISKIIVFYIYELIREYMLIVPILLGFGLFNISRFTFWFMPWSLIVMLFVPCIVVLAAALISIPSLFVARFANRYPVVKLVLFFMLVGAATWAIVKVVGIIPENLDFTKIVPPLRRLLVDFFDRIGRYLPPIEALVGLLIGEQNKSLTYNVFTARTVLYFGILLFSAAALFAITYFVSRPIFFKMMSKSFEFEKKSVNKARLNKKHGKLYAFTLKEFRLCILNTEVSLSFLTVYMLVPVMIFVLNKLYSAINTRLAGQVMTYAFTLLIMLLPMLASNGMIAKLFSKEGRAAYMKKTEPVNILEPIFAKLSFFLILSVPSIIASVAVFGSFVSQRFHWYDLVFLGGTIIFVQWAHILYSALTDIMNPQNEQYATVGESAQNPNENKATITAFALSAFFAFFGYVLFNENPAITGATVKLFLIAAVMLGVMTLIFVKSIKAYYYEK